MVRLGGKEMEFLHACSATILTSPSTHSLPGSWASNKPRGPDSSKEWKYESTYYNMLTGIIWLISSIFSLDTYAIISETPAIKLETKACVYLVLAIIMSSHICSTRQRVTGRGRHVFSGQAHVSLLGFGPTSDSLRLEAGHMRN